MVDFPTSLVDFQRRFSDEDACAAWLFEARWSTGFRCPACDHDKAWPHGGKAFTYECAACGRQTSVTALRRLSLATLHRPYNQTHYLRNVDPTGTSGISL